MMSATDGDPSEAIISAPAAAAKRDDVMLSSRFFGRSPRIERPHAGRNSEASSAIQPRRTGGLRLRLPIMLIRMPRVCNAILPMAGSIVRSRNLVARSRRRYGLIERMPDMVARQIGIALGFDKAPDSAYMV